MMTSVVEKNEYFCSASPRDKEEFVTVVSVDPVEPAKGEQPFVTILSIGDDGAGETAQTAPRSADCGEEVLVYRLPGERLGFGLKFDGGSNVAECVTKLLIQSCAPDSPASRTVVSWGHFAPGDEILEIDGVPVSRMTRMECVRSLKESNVQLKLRVRKGDGIPLRNASNAPTKNPAPPPVPPRKYPRRNSRQGLATGAGTAPLLPPDGFGDKIGDTSCSPQMTRLREKLCIPEAQTYTDLLAQEATSCSLLACHESESDDTGSSMSTVVDGGCNGKHFSASTTSNSSFSDVRSVASSIDVETGAAPSLPVSDDEALRRSRKYDLDRVLEPFLQLEREFSSCATTIEHHDLFQKLVAAAALNNEGGALENGSAPAPEIVASATNVMLEPPDVFQDATSYQQQRLGVKDDLNNNTILSGDEYVPSSCSANDISVQLTNSIKAHNDVPDDEIPPKPLPRREIPCKTLTKYGKRRPPPPPPPPQVSAKPNRCPTPNEANVADLQHESSDSDISVDRLPRLIDFVPKDRVDVVVPSAVHPNPMDMLLERQRIMSMVNQNAGPAETVPNAVPEFCENHLLNESPIDLRNSSLTITSTVEDLDDPGSTNESINACSEVEVCENRIESEPNETSAHAQCIDSVEDTTTMQSTDNRSLTMVSQIESDKLRSCEPSTTSETVKSPSLPTNYATLPCKEEESTKMKPLLAVSSSVNLSTPTSPPSYSRMPPDGHEFPQNYHEIGPSGNLFELNISQDITAASIPLKEASYQEPSTLARKSAVTAYTSDVLNEAKFLDIDRKQPSQLQTSPFGNTAQIIAKMPVCQTLSDAPKRHSQSWRNDERSERSVKDKIAMFSDAISKAAPSSATTSRSPKLRDMDASSKAFSKSMCAVNTIANGNVTCAVVAPRFKSKDSYCTARDDVDSSSASTNHGTSMNRAQSSIDLTLFSSSCSSAYSSCSPDSSLSPMSSPSYTIGSSSTLPRKNKSPPASCDPNANISVSSCNGAGSKNSNGKNHPVLGRTISFCGSTPSPLHTRSQSLVDVLHVSSDNHHPHNPRKDSLTTLIEQRRRTMSKLRGLVIPEKMCNQVALKPIMDLPEIKSKEVSPDAGDNNVSQQTHHQNLSNLTKNNNSHHYSKKTDVVIDCAWKPVLNPADIPKYSPAFKRKTLTVYGVSSSASSLSSSLNSSREELRDSGTTAVMVTNKKSPPPAKPPRSCHNQLVYGPTIYKSIFANKQPAVIAPVNREKSEYQISRNEGSKLQEDSDNDSAVSSSRSSLCQEYSPPSSPSPGAGSAEVGSYDNDRISNDSPSQSSSCTLRRTLSSETSVSLVSTASTLTSGSQASCSSNGGDGFCESSKRVLKAESVEAINRKNVLSSAKYSCGKDFKVGSPLIKDVYDGHRFSDTFNGVRKEREWFEYEKYDNNNPSQTEIKVAYLEEIQDEGESDSSVKGSSSVDTDEALDKSLDSTDSLCDNYKSDYLLLDHRQSVESVKKEVGSDSDFAEPLSEDSFISEKSILSELLKSEDLRKSKLASERIVGKRCSVLDVEPKKSVSDIKKTFERAGGDTAATTVMAFRKMRPSMHSQQNHLRMSSTDSTTSEDSLPASSIHSLNTNLLKEQQFGSITSLASSSSLISQQELQQLIDDASQTLEESSASGDHDLMVIILHRDTVTSSIGITLAGGADYEAKEITVHKVLVGSPADKDGRIQKGDRILSINGRNMKGVTHREALSILKAPRPEVVLVVSRWKADGPSSNTAMVEDPLVATFKSTVRPPRIPEVLQDCDNENLTSVTNNTLVDKLKKGPVMPITLLKEGGGLGFSLEGGKDSPFGDLPLTIKKIFTGGCAAKSGLLMAGDELVSLNNVDVTTMSRTEAWSLMKRLEPGQVVLNIRRSLKE